VSPVASAEEPKLALRHRWVYLRTNLLVEEKVSAAIELFERAAKADYTGILLYDYKFILWDRMPERYFRNVRRVREACRKLKLELIACVMPIGYSGGLLFHDPNLAAGLPVKDAPFVVQDGKLLPADDVQLANGDFETYHGHRPTGWQWVDKPGQITFIDTEVKFSGQASLRMENIDQHAPKHGNGRFAQKLKVRPYRYYHLSAAVKTENFTEAKKVRITVLAQGVLLNYYELGVKPTQDWTRVHVAFNTLEFDEVSLHLGVWQGKSGKIWWDDVQLEPGGLVNVIRRAGAPLRITSEDGQTDYVEGKDFTGARDPFLGTKPHRGAFSVWHTPPVVTVPVGSRLKEGQRLRVSYFHPAVIYRGQVSCDLTEPKVYEILDRQIRGVRDGLDPDGYLMEHDEIRVQGWEPAFERRKLTPGAALAENVRRCTDIIRKHAPGKPIYVWSDMFDLHHNAKKTGRYFLVKGDGPWSGSWKGLASDVIVANWHQNRLDSLKHFAARGHRQILAGYFDRPPERIAEWLRQATQVRGVIGVIYVTWGKQNFDDLEKFAAEVNKFR